VETLSAMSRPGINARSIERDRLVAGKHSSSIGERDQSLPIGRRARRSLEGFSRTLHNSDRAAQDIHGKCDKA
jgi:hypothetical protein